MGGTSLYLPEAQDGSVYAAVGAGGSLLTALLAMALGLVLTLVIGRYVLDGLRALHAGQQIREDGPTWHASKAGTPTMGGIMFILGSGIAVAALGIPALAAGVSVHLSVYALALAFGLIGLADDLRKVLRHQNEGLTARQKLVLQLAASVVFLTVMRGTGHLTDTLRVPWIGAELKVGWYAYLVFAAFVIVGCVNAVNLTDGVDGLAGSVTLVVTLFFTASGIVLGGGRALFPAALAGSLAAFLVYNRHPAKVFMGDTGSLFLGGAVAAMAFAMDLPLILVPVGIVYILETLSDILQVAWFKYTKRRYGAGRRIFRMAPLHHHLELSGWSEERLCAAACLLTAAGCLLAWLGVPGR